MNIRPHPSVAPYRTVQKEQPAGYSAHGNALAVQGLDSYDQVRTDPSRATVQLNQQFKMLRTSVATTATEKEIATLGRRLSGYDADPEVVARVQRAAMSAVASAISGPAGQVLAQVGLQLVGVAGGDPSFARVVAKETLRSLATSGLTDDRQKDLAALGVEFGAHRMPSSEATALRRTVLEEIGRSSGEASPAPQMLARATGRSVVNNQLSRWSDIDKTMATGLKEILAHPKSSDRDRTLARHGLSLGEGLNARAAVAVREAFLTELIQESFASGPTSLAKAGVSLSDSELTSSTKRRLMDSIFQQVSHHRDSTQRQKELARYALQNADGDYMYADSFRRQYMNYVAEAGW